MTAHLLNKTEVASLTGLSERHIQRLCKQGAYLTTQVRGNGGLQYRVALSSLPLEAQRRYCEMFSIQRPISSGAQPDTSETHEELSGAVPAAPAPAQEALTTLHGVPVSAEDVTYYNGLTDWERENIDRWLPLFSQTEGMKGRELKGYLENNGYQNSTAAYQSYCRWRSAFRASGIRGLVYNYGSRASMKETSIREEWFSLFCDLYLNQNLRSLTVCWEDVKGYALKHGQLSDPHTFPCASSFKRLLDKRVPTQAVYYHRHGEAAWNRRFGAHISRDLSNLKPMQVLVGDHSLFDFFVDFKGAAVRPVLTAWGDFASCMLVGYDIHVGSSSSDHIKLALSRAFRDYGLCDSLYMDNGKDFRKADIAGGRTAYDDVFADGRMNNLITMCGIQRPKYCIPYRAQSKIIERVFGLFREYFDKFMPGYAGCNAQRKPEDLHIQNALKEGKLIPYEEFCTLFDSFLKNVYQHRAFKSGMRSGKTPLEIVNSGEGTRRTLTEDAIAMLTLRCSRPVSIARNRAVDPEYGTVYYGDWMVAYEGTGKKAYMWRDPMMPGKAWFRDADDDRFLGIGTDVFSAPAWSTTEEEYKKLAAAQSAVSHVRKQVKNAVKTSDVSMHEHLDYQKALIEATRKDIPEREIESVTVLTGYDRMVQEAEEMAKTGTYDIGLLKSRDPQPRKKKKKIYLLNSDRKRDL